MKAKKLVRSLTVVLAAGLALSSCKNDLEINADYDKTPVIYGLINQYDSIQSFKITKTFIGDENPNTYAAIPDSSYFSEVSATVTEGSSNRKFDLYPRVVTNKEPGTFFNPNQVIYQFAQRNIQSNYQYLNQESKYYFNANLDGVEVSAETALLFDASPGYFKSRGWLGIWNEHSTGLSFANGEKLLDMTIEGRLPYRSKVAQLKMIFNYTDYLLVNGQRQEEQHTLVYDFGQLIFDNPITEATAMQEFVLTGGQFFNKIATSVPDAANTPNLEFRMAGHCDFIFIAGNEDFYYYRQVTQPSDDLNQDKPNFTNLSTGIGIIAARMELSLVDFLARSGENLYEAGRLSMKLNRATQHHLSRGLEGGTAAKGFCIDPEVANTPNEACQF
ncbi:hypothetical protein KFE98_10980 [bacterium SCSIO 12741]|nr:hypothetical protein KFE98_10980 [bacterium SCSIO 12741]